MTWPEIAHDLQTIWGWVCALFDWICWVSVRIGFALCVILFPVSVIVLVELAAYMKRKSKNTSI